MTDSFCFNPPIHFQIHRGQYCHNTKVYDNGDLSNQTYQSGAWQKFRDTEIEKETFATLLQSAGYQTALVGKYMNGYDRASHVPPGFDHWMGMMGMQYYGPVFSDNGSRLALNKTVYQTDFIRDWALEFLKHKRDSSKPFFLMLTPFAPHTPATPAKRHEAMFSNLRFPRYESFNPPDQIQRNRPAWIKDMPPLTDQQIDGMDNFYRNRLRSLQAVDEALESLVETLQHLGLEDNTWFFYTSDNGQHFGDFRIPAGKRQAYETDVLVPFLVRGPGVPIGTKFTQAVIQSVDLAPTFLDLASRHSTKLLQSSYEMDGKSIVPLLTGTYSPTTTNNDFRWVALLEMYGGSSNIGQRYSHMKQYYYQNHMFPNTYQAARVVHGPSWASQADWLYVEWCTGEQELYNMTEDPHQVYNLAATADKLLLYHLSQLLAWLGDCKGRECHEPSGFSTLTLDTDLYGRRELPIESLQQSIRDRIPCFNPPNWTSSIGDLQLGRKPFAVDLPVSDPFGFGFPFSDGDVVPGDLLELWEQYQHYFY